MGLTNLATDEVKNNDETILYKQGQNHEFLFEGTKLQH